jgi:hypothetical protein
MADPTQLTVDLGGIEVDVEEVLRVAGQLLGLARGASADVLLAQILFTVGAALVSSVGRLLEGDTPKPLPRYEEVLRRAIEASRAAGGAR